MYSVPLFHTMYSVPLFIPLFQPPRIPPYFQPVISTPPITAHPRESGDPGFFVATKVRTPRESKLADMNLGIRLAISAMSTNPETAPSIPLGRGLPSVNQRQNLDPQSCLIAMKAADHCIQISRLV